MRLAPSLGPVAKVDRGGWVCWVFGCCVFGWTVPTMADSQQRTVSSTCISDLNRRAHACTSRLCKRCKGQTPNNYAPAPPPLPLAPTVLPPPVRGSLAEAARLLLRCASSCTRVDTSCTTPSSALHSRPGEGARQGGKVSGGREREGVGEGDETSEAGAWMAPVATVQDLQHPRVYALALDGAATTLPETWDPCLPGCATTPHCFPCPLH